MNDPVRTRVDVVVLGGGLAGLTLALQLRQRLPDLQVTVLERRRHPVPEAAHKVGESSVEIAANYFDTVLGLREHLVSRQLKKFGFRFFFSDGRMDIDKVVELGASRYLATPSYQIDRGIFENFLGQRAREAGVDFREGASVRELALSKDGGTHRVCAEIGGEVHAFEARWVVDASGRAAILKRQLGLESANDHDVNSAWFRVGARVDVNEWSDDRRWLDRCDPPDRWLSTNHLVGEGYWVWLIPLASGSHSVGIVADGRLHPLRRISSFDRAMDWLREHQPRLALDIEGKGHLLQDFAFLKHFSHGCRQVFSGDRWAITGEAGVFLDPFYSPGGDFIAIANTYITELVALERMGQPAGSYARIYEQFFMSFCDSTMSLYRDQYPIFGDPGVLPVKVIWDYAYYWGVLCQIFFQRRLTDLRTLTRVRDDLQASRARNAAMQPFLREWSLRGHRTNPPVLLDQAALGWFEELNRGLRDTLDEEAFVARIRDTTRLLERLAHEIVATADRQCKGLDARGVLALLGPRPDEAGAGMLLRPAA